MNAWRRMLVRRMLVLGVVLALPAALAAQEPDVRAQLAARGAPPDLAQGVAAIAADAAARGLPQGPLVDKALEGWAKHAPPDRILSVVRRFAARMDDAREAVALAGLAAPPGELVAAAAEALGRGLSAPQVGEVVRAAPQVPLTAPGLRVVAALAAQGLPVDQAVAVVADALRGGRTMAQLLDMPSVMRAMQGQGMSPPEIGRQMMEGGGAGEHPEGMRPGAGAGAAPGGGRAPMPMGPGGRPGSGNPPPPPGGHRPPRRP